MVNLYGIPKYKEINPGIFSIVTFPYLFAVMFGDVGHGLILFAIGLYLINKPLNILSPLHSIRYLILMMGIFSVYCGFIYNEFFGKPLILFDKCFKEGQ